MEKISRAKLIAWAKKNNWLHVNEGGTPDGRQDTFLAPSGAFRIIIFDMSGNLHSVADPLLQAQFQALMQAQSKAIIPDFSKLGKG